MSWLASPSTTVHLRRLSPQAVHDMLSENLSALMDHSARHCVVCSPDESSAGAGPGGDRSAAPPAPPPAAAPKVSLMDRLNARWKVKGQQVKEKLVDIITNAAVEQQAERHVSSQDRGKRYRNIAPVFSLDDDEEGRELKRREGGCGIGPS